jgi:hypothetical protein
MLKFCLSSNTGLKNTYPTALNDIMKHPKFDKQDYEIIFPLIIFLIVGSGLISLGACRIIDMSV